MGDIEQGVTSSPTERAEQSAEALFNEHVVLPDALKNKFPARMESGWRVLLLDNILPVAQSLLFFGMGKGKATTETLTHEGKTYYRIVCRAGLASTSVVVSAFGAYVLGTLLLELLRHGTIGRKHGAIVSPELGEVYLPGWAIFPTLKNLSKICSNNDAFITMLKEELSKAAVPRNAEQETSMEKKADVVLH